MIYANDDNYLVCTKCKTTDRTSEFDCAFQKQDNGCWRVLIVPTLDESIIETGTGSIVTLTYAVKDEGPSEGCTDINQEEVQVRDEEEILSEIISEPGEFCFEAPQTTTSTTSIPSLNIVSPSTIWRSIWIPLPYLIDIQGHGIELDLV